jgi:exopolysaccharide biosynthesis operon protein EpsL
MRCKTILAATALLCFPGAASAFQTIDNMTWPEQGRFPAYPPEQPDGRTVRFFVYGGVMHDSNIFRLSDSTNPQTAIGSTEKSDTIYRAGAGLKADIPVSRQRILLDAQIEHQEFDRFSILNHDPYRLGAAWKWVAGPQWSGDIGYSRRRYLANLGEIQAPIKDLITEDRAFASAGYMVTPRWRVRGAADWTEWDHSDPTRITLDNRTTSVTAGLDYVTPPGNSVGGQVKYSEGEFPNQQVVAGSFVDNRFKEWETSAVAHWAVTGKSVLDARLGYTSREHDQVPQRDFDGATGRLSYDWFVGPKTPLNFSLWREIQSVAEVSASYVLNTGWSIGPSWAPTEKLVFHAKYLREDRDYRGDPGFILTGGPQREDTLKGISLAAGYAPRRNIELAVSVVRGDRDSNVFGRDYDYTTVAANAKFKF